MNTNNSIEISKDELKFIHSHTPTSSTDSINIGYSDNGALLMQMISLTPDAIIENHRTVLSPESVEDFIDMLCEVTEYYPKKPRKLIKKASKPKRKKI